MPIAQVFETKIKIPSKPFKFFCTVVTGNNYLVDLNKAHQYASSEIIINFGMSQKGFLQYSIAKNSSVIDGRTIYVMFVF